MLLQKSANLIKVGMISIQRAEFTDQTTNVFRVAKVDMLKWNPHRRKNCADAVHQLRILHTSPGQVNNCDVVCRSCVRSTRRPMRIVSGLGSIFRIAIDSL